MAIAISIFVSLLTKTVRMHTNVNYFAVCQYIFVVVLFLGFVFIFGSIVSLRVRCGLTFDLTPWRQRLDPRVLPVQVVYNIPLLVFVFSRSCSIVSVIFKQVQSCLLMSSHFFLALPWGKLLATYPWRRTCGCVCHSIAAFETRVQNVSLRFWSRCTSSFIFAYLPPADVICKLDERYRS